MSSVSTQPQFRYTQPPSKVLHLRNLPWECVEEELIELGKPFGKVVNTKCNVGANKNQAFIEYALIKRDHGYSKLYNMAAFEIEFVHVPQQTNLHDCGLFVLKWIEAVNDEGLWTQKDYYKRLTDYRDRKMLELLTWDMNRKKIVLEFEFENART